MSECRIDFETRSDVDLKTCGAAPYFASPHFRALIACYAIDGGSIRTWTSGPCPDDLRAHIEAGGMLRAHNASFERQCFDEMHRRCGWPRPKIDRYRCTAAQAAVMGLPRALDRVGAALGAAVQKDKRGAALIRKFSIPRQPFRHETGPGPFWNEPEDHPVDFADFVAYCQRDVEAESAVAKRLVPLSDAEQSVYTLDQVINSRGVRIDRASAVAAVELVAKATAALDARMAFLTNGAVPKCSAAAKLTAWVAERGVLLDGVAKDDILDALKLADLPPAVRQALEVRQEGAKPSTAKLGSFLRRASAGDDRIRGAFVYHAASTGRWSSEGANLGNLPRPRPLYEDAALDAAALFRAFKTRDPDVLRLLYGPELGKPLHLVSDALRGFVWAAPGHELMAVDYSGIEGAVAAWIAGEEWKLKALREILADPSLPDLYRRTAASIMNTTTDVITKKHFLRQAVGKVSELALGFGGGVAAFVSMAKTYDIDLDMLFEPVWATATDESRTRAIRRYERCLKAKDRVKTDVLSREAWLACELIKVMWRQSNAKIAGAWPMLGDAMRNAIENPGQKFEACKVTWLVAMGFLWARLPSGRCLAYGAPRLSAQVWARPIGEDGVIAGDAEILPYERAVKLQAAGHAKIEGKAKPAVTALGVNAKTHRYERFALYEGLAFENIVQGIARDFLVNGMVKAEAAGIGVVMHVYDELVAEVPAGTGDIAAFEALVCDLPAWGEGMPLSAHGWIGKRYRK